MSDDTDDTGGFVGEVTNVAALADNPSLAIGYFGAKLDGIASKLRDSGRLMAHEFAEAKTALRRVETDLGAEIDGLRQDVAVVQQDIVELRTTVTEIRPKGGLREAVIDKTIIAVVSAFVATVVAGGLGVLTASKEKRDERPTIAPVPAADHERARSATTGVERPRRRADDDE